MCRSMNGDLASTTRTDELEQYSPSRPSLTSMQLDSSVKEGNMDICPILTEVADIEDEVSESDRMERRVDTASISTPISCEV